jgi:hypothetical protein
LIPTPAETFSDLVAAVGVNVARGQLEREKQLAIADLKGCIRHLQALQALEYMVVPE